MTDRGTEYCGKREQHEYQIYLALQDVYHTKTKARSPQTNGICERFHRTVQEEFYAVAFRKKIYRSIEELQQDLDAWVEHYNKQRTHSGKHCFGKTPYQTFLDSLHLAKAKMLEQQNDPNLTFFSDQNPSKKEEGFEDEKNVEQRTVGQKQEKSYLSDTTSLQTSV